MKMTTIIKQPQKSPHHTFGNSSNKSLSETLRNFIVRIELRYNDSTHFFLFINEPTNTTLLANAIPTSISNQITSNMDNENNIQLVFNSR